ncbi:MAG: hypothetical protein J0H68_08045 [Sphingobacteriia bacterium]|nr:hypothetical protein [Sphingobacteriia bacterium]
MNKIRGEVKFKANKSEYVLIPTFNAIAAIEGELEKSIIRILNEIETKGLTLLEQKVIIKHGLKASNIEITNEELIEIIQSVGYINTYKYSCEFLSNIIAKPKI